jgi:predicted NUDIX family NTP pyrophosphohydrolase
MASKKKSAGILLLRFKNGAPEFFLAHLGGPFWAHRDEKAWCFPKGELDPGEDDLTTAKREWVEETNLPPPEGKYIDLGLFSSKSKEVRCFCVIGDAPSGELIGNPVTIEHPKNSGIQITFPETDRAEWFDAETAKIKLHSYLSSCVDVALEKIIP